MGILFTYQCLPVTNQSIGLLRCDGWKDLTSEVRQDEYLDEQTKSDLIDYFKTKVEEECDFKP